MESIQKKFTKEELTEICLKACDQQGGGVEIKCRKNKWKTYDDVFLGTEFTQWLVNNKYAPNPAEAVALGQQCIENDLLIHTLRDHGFKNQALFYKFLVNDKTKGYAEEGITWHQFQELNGKSLNSQELIQQLQGKSDLMEKNNGGHVYDMLFDKFNCDMYDNVRPAKWVDPKVDGNFKYDLLVIGGGAAAMVSAAGASGLGAKTCMIEKGFFGGDCLVTGCVPSKAFLKAATVVHTVNNCSDYGVKINGTVEVDFPALMERMKRIRANISNTDAIKRFTDHYGVDVYLGHGSFKNKNTVVVNGQELTFSKAVIATGGRPLVPDYPGVDKIKFYNSDNIWNLTEFPKKMLIVGSGPIGSELGQGFARIGTEVTMLERGKQFLPRDDPDGVALLADQMAKDGVKMLFETAPKEFAPVEGSDKVMVSLKQNNGEIIEAQEYDVVLLATGRLPNVENLGLDEAGVKYDKKGVKTDKYLRTSNSNIYSCGDCVEGMNFTHNSNIQARYVIYNSLFMNSKDKNKIILPYATYTHPEVAQVGYNEVQLKKQGIAYDTYSADFSHNDRALCESNEGLYKIHTKKGTDEILGSTLVGGPAGDLIVNVTVAMHNKIGLKKMGECVHPYPTYAEAFLKMADDFNRQALKPGVKSVLRGIISFNKK